MSFNRYAHISFEYTDGPVFTITRQSRRNPKKKRRIAHQCCDFSNASYLRLFRIIDGPVGERDYSVYFDHRGRTLGANFSWTFTGIVNETA